MRQLFALILGLSIALPLQAVVRQDLAERHVVAMLDGAPLTLPFVDLMHRLALRSNDKATRMDVVQAIVDDRLLAAYARSRYPRDELVEDNKVGYKPAVQIEQALVTYLQAAFGPRIAQALRAEKGGSLAALVQARRTPTTADWSAVLGASPGMLLEYGLDETGRKAAAAVILLRYRFDNATTGTITLLDVYDAQHVQGRHELHARNAAFADAQAQLLMERRYVLHWAQRRSGLTADEFAAFRQAVEDRMTRQGWMALLGVSSDIHDTPEHLKTLAAAVSAEEIRRYYDSHRDEFRRIEKVRARHILVRDEQQAHAVQARLQQGEDFASVARAISAAADAASGGDLGWLVHGAKPASWLESLAFMQRPGVVSRPFRLPARPDGSSGWEILLVEEKIEGYQPPDSESVRYVAAQALARQKAAQEYQGTLLKLRADAELRLNPLLLSGERSLQP